MEIKDTYSYKSTILAEYLAAIANERRLSINMTKLQKLLYIVYGAYLRIYEERLLNEHPQAWPYGPVFPSTRNHLLKKDLYDIELSSIDEQLKADDRLNRVIDFVLAKFGTWNAGQLSVWSHSSGSPWDKTTNVKGFRWGDVIPDTFILSYFTEIITIRPNSDGTKQP